MPPEEDEAHATRHKQDGVSAPTYRGFFHAPERGIMPNYDKDIRFAAKTADRYELREEKEAVAAETCKDEKKQQAMRYGSWMLGRRVGDYRRFAMEQSIGNHEPVQSKNGKLVCVCGLITEVSENGDNADEEFAKAKGHL